MLGIVVPVAAVASATPTPRPVAVIPFVRNDKLMMVKVRIGNSRPLWFTVDSGARHSVLDPATAKMLHLRLGAAGTTTGTGKGAVPLVHAAPVTLVAGSAVVRVAAPIVIDLSRVPLPKPSAGLLGAELFEQYIVRIDYGGREIRLFDRSARFANDSLASVPLRERKHAFYVPVTVVVNGTPHAVDARIDLGSGDSLSSPLVKLSREQRTTTLGAGLGRDFRGASGVYDSVSLGPYRIKHVWAPWSETPMIGMEIFRRFITTFDVAHGRLYLEPAAALADPVPSPAS
ncbi:MAG: hypothetical protein JWM87_3374 [Candidatus Eremiobacteraeota bacterium]|nr:hypothetical protein [Candidatus Eremiobacteraeota bacterium]